MTETNDMNETTEVTEMTEMKDMNARINEWTNVWMNEEVLLFIF